MKKTIASALLAASSLPALAFSIGDVFGGNKLPTEAELHALVKRGDTLLFGAGVNKITDARVKAVKCRAMEKEGVEALRKRVTAFGLDAGQIKSFVRCDFDWEIDLFNTFMGKPEGTKKGQATGRGLFLVEEREKLMWKLM